MENGKFRSHTQWNVGLVLSLILKITSFKSLKMKIKSFMKYFKNGS